MQIYTFLLEKCKDCAALARAHCECEFVRPTVFLFLYLLVPSVNTSVTHVLLVIPIRQVKNWGGKKRIRV